MNGGRGGNNGEGFPADSTAYGGGASGGSGGTGGVYDGSTTIVTPSAGTSGYVIRTDVTDPTINYF